MKSFYIVPNRDKDKDLEVTRQVTDYLARNGCRSVVCQPQREKAGRRHYTDPDQVPDGTDCVLVLGGDGTLLQAARDLVNKKLPLLGINLGRLGFLAEVEKSSLFPSLDMVIRDEYTIEERMMARGTVSCKGRVVGQDTALNDIVIAREGHLRVVSFISYVNGEFLNSCSADGMIISTPTGSTGYNLSAGGPLVSPQASMFIMTPVAPHTISTRSLVFPEEDVITVEVGAGHMYESEKAFACFDGDTVFPMETGDTITICRAETSVRILKLKKLSFVEVLRQKMNSTQEVQRETPTS